MAERGVELLVQLLKWNLEQLGTKYFDLDKEIKKASRWLNYEPTASELKIINKRLSAAINYQNSHDGAVSVPVSVVEDPEFHEEWYDEWLQKHDNLTDSFYWKRLENYLSMVLLAQHGAAKSGKIVRSIDDSTKGIIKRLANPRRSKFSYKGLVVGYVQSGKTANFSALIAKAADAGYKFIIVLAGIHDVLRLQTQIRLDRELTGMNDRMIQESFILQPPDAKSWGRLATANNDFSKVNLGPFNSVCHKNTPTLAVIKKNCTVMGNLINYISSTSSNKARENMPLLIIDDEADQASINTKSKDPDSDPSKTNVKIREMLSLFPRKAYVGYTATPFANVLVDMTAKHERLEDDIYPRNFIVSLPEPEGYFGSAAIFKSELATCFVKEVPDDKEKLLGGTTTAGLMEAIDEFIVCCAIRNLRDDRSKPMSMLVHVSSKISDMDTMNGLVAEYLTIQKTKLEDSAGSKKMKSNFEKILHQIHQSSKQINEYLGLNNKLPEFRRVWSEIPRVMSSMTVLLLNSASEDKLDYTQRGEIKVIAIGGNQLSRGLTLEGLMSSYYLRSSKQYDTLLQMGRWFGYRSNYEDLTRIYTTREIWGFFEHLALVESEMRSQIYRYEDENRTPAELAIAIRMHSTLKITAPSKMGKGRPQQVSYSRSLNQTIWFPLDQPSVLQANYKLGDKFVNILRGKSKFVKVRNSYLVKGIPGTLVVSEFLKKYSFVQKAGSGGPGMDSQSLISYVERRLRDVDNPELKSWNIALVGNEKPLSGADDPLGYGGLKINRIRRTRKHTENGYCIGVLTEPDDLVIDLHKNASNPYDKRSPQNPLMLFYIVWGGSQPKKYVEEPSLNERVELYRGLKTEKKDVLGIAIVLPESRVEPYDYFGQ